MSDSANIDPRSAWVKYVCTDCERVFDASPYNTAIVEKGCYCGGDIIKLRDLQLRARAYMETAVPMSRRPWSKTDENNLRYMFADDQSDFQIARALGRTERGVAVKRHKLGLVRYVMAKEEA